MNPSAQPYKPKRPRTVSASVHMWADCAKEVRKYAADFDPPLSMSGAIHKLLRTHPDLDLEDFD
jgi:hypothetical protein